MKHKFKKPFKFEDKEYKELELNLEGLTGSELQAVERELAFSGMAVMNVSTSQTACLYLAAKAAKIPSELIMALPIAEATEVSMKVQHFLLGLESKTPTL